MSSLQGTKAVVFGASSGVGRATAKLLAAHGAQVVLAGRDASRLDTGYWRGVPGDTLKAIFDRAAKALPAGRVGTGDDIAEAALFLATNSFVTGQVLQADGGIELSSLCMNGGRA